MKGVLLINLGSPDSTQIKDVKKYLGEFLMDDRVIDIPYWKRLLLVKGIILNVLVILPLVILNLLLMEHVEYVQLRIVFNVLIVQLVTLVIKLINT